MNDPLTEDERLAALADGRLGERERADVLARLTADDDAYEVLSSLAAILHEAEAADGVPLAPVADAGIGVGPEPAEVVDEGGSAPLPVSRTAGAALPVADPADIRGATDDSEPRVTVLRPRTPALRWLALAAGIAGLALAGALWSRSSSAGEPVRLAARLEHGDQGLPLEWKPPWSSVRGDGIPGGMSAQERAAHAARAGALLVDLSVAVRGRDATRTQLLSRQIAERYDPQRSRAGVWKEIEANAGGPPKRLDPLIARATDRIAGRLEREGLELGAWTEAARLAAKRHDARFFADRGTREMLDRLASRAAAHPSARAAVERVRALAEADPLQWEALAGALDALSSELASA